MCNRTIAISRRNNFTYPEEDSEFRPSTEYPEYLFKDDISKSNNEAYDQVRSCFALMGYDKDNFGKKEWNPLKEIIKPGNNVLIKPNFVQDKNLSGDTEKCLYTQPAVIAPVIDYVILALGFAEGYLNGKITIADAAMQECNFELLVKKSGLDKLIEFYKKKGIEIHLVDTRKVIMENNPSGIPYYHEREVVSHIVSLDNESEFAKLTDEENRRLRKGANDPNDLYEHHHVGKHEYAITDTLLACDVLIDMPKPKTHKKAGVTIALKNMVGVNVRKEYLPHHMEGSKSSGKGDAYKNSNIFKAGRAAARDKVYVYALQNKRITAKFMRFLRRAFAFLMKCSSKDIVTEGTWYGNNTISKTIIDLNKICMYADKNGVMQDRPQRKRIIVADMIISGEGAGPLAPTAKKVGVIAVGTDAVMFDECIAKIMGANINRIPTLVNARSVLGKYQLTTTNSVGLIRSECKEWDGKTSKTIDAKDTLGYIPISEWQYAFNNDDLGEV